MARASRPLLSGLLLVLLTTWGICPCTMARALGIGEDAPAAPQHAAGSSTVAPAPTAPRCCCKCGLQAESEEGDDGEGRTPAKDDCPCCKRGGWMRDLPPQAQTLDLDAPALAAFDLPLFAPTILVERRVPGVARRDSGPPTALRPHAAPVGIVRLLS